MRYTGQIHLPEVGFHHFKARAYSPRWGRFLQTDPIGAADNANIYAYVGNDLINFVDPNGLLAEQVGSAAWDLTNRAEDFASRLYQDSLLKAADDMSRHFNRFRQDPLPAVASVANSFPQTRVEGSIATTLAAVSALGRAGGPIAGAAVRAIPTWKGAGPIPGTFGVNAETASTRGLQNFFPKRGNVEYIFDPDTSTLIVGSGKWTHSPLAASINADPSRVVGGMFGRGSSGTMLTNEASGHFWRNWTPEVRQQFNQMMRSRGFNHLHREGM